MNENHEQFVITDIASSHIMSPFAILVITIRKFIKHKNNLEKGYIKIINLNVVPGFLRNQTDKMFISLVGKEA